MPTGQIPKKPDEFKYWIEYQLKLNRSSFANVARRLGITRQAVSQKVNSPSERIAEAIAADLKIPKKRLWPERFNA